MEHSLPREEPVGAPAVATAADRCASHPDAEAPFWCAKSDRRHCASCVRCAQPENHCTFRTQCVIWEIEKHGGLDNWTKK